LFGIKQDIGPVCVDLADAWEKTRAGKICINVEKIAGALTCPYPSCSLACPSPNKLITHYFTHTREKPFKCSRCELRYTRLDIRNQHQRLNHDNSSKPLVKPGNTNSVSIDNDNDNDDFFDIFPASALNSTQNPSRQSTRYSHPATPPFSIDIDQYDGISVKNEPNKYQITTSPQANAILTDLTTTPPKNPNSFDLDSITQLISDSDEIEVFSSGVFQLDHDDNVPPSINPQNNTQNSKPSPLTTILKDTPTSMVIIDPLDPNIVYTRDGTYGACCSNVDQLWTRTVAGKICTRLFEDPGFISTSPYRCPYGCVSASFSSKNKFLSHYLTHTNEKPFRYVF